MGLAVAQKLSSEYWNLVIVDLDGKAGAKAVADLSQTTQAVFVEADVTNYASQIAAFETAILRFESLDFVFANAGIAGRGGYYDKAADWPPKAPSLLLQDVCLTGVVYSSWLGMHYMRRNKVPGGIIIMTASGSFYHPRHSAHQLC
jgi:15-hydroxyprostaglandin dehydrogenase (NAD)